MGMANLTKKPQVHVSGNRFHRCRIPQCDLPNDAAAYDVEWFSSAIPSSGQNGRPASCMRYAITNSSAIRSGQCTADMFDRNTTIRCNDFVFKTNEHRLLQKVKTKYQS